MSLLLSNRKISDEARGVAYRHFSATIGISTSRLYSDSRRRGQGMFDPTTDLPTPPSESNIRDWQLDLHFRTPYSSSYAQDQPWICGNLPSIEVDRLIIGEGVLQAVAALAKIENLQTLKVKFPCFCQKIHIGGPSCDRILQLIHKVLEPLKTLHIQNSATFIAAQPLVDGTHISRGPWWRTRDIQCQQPGCLTFTARLKDLKDFLESSLPRKRLSAQQLKWLDITHRVAKAEVYNRYRIKHSLHHLWTLTESYRDVIADWHHRSQDVRQREFNKYYKTVMSGHKAGIKEERVWTAKGSR
ncbi:MAG: hypothetical protein LQ338_006434 [Usnochroma carphineum]|nr:MAG: hypothetical protein LQ338_006434 [Usnochroma carphineum]